MTAHAPHPETLCPRAAQGVASLDTVIASGGGGSFSFKIGDSGQTETITVGASMTLDDLRDAINEADAGLTASIVNDGSDTSPYRLVLKVAQRHAVLFEELNQILAGNPAILRTRDPVTLEPA